MCVVVVCLDELAEVEPVFVVCGVAAVHGQFDGLGGGGRERAEMVGLRLAVAEQGGVARAGDAAEQLQCIDLRTRCSEHFVMHIVRGKGGVYRGNDWRKFVKFLYSGGVYSAFA